MLRSLSVVGSLTLLSRILGFVRDIVIATLFGATAGADAFLVAFKIPNFMRRLFAEGAFSQAFVPVLSEYKTNSPEKVQSLIDHVAGTLGFVLLILTVLGIVFAPYLIMLFAPGFVDEPHKYQLAVDMLRITFPYLLFVSLTAFAAGILNSYDHFSSPAFSPVIMNVCMIAASLGFTQYFQEPILALAWSVLISGILQFGFQLPFLSKLHLMPIPRLKKEPDEGVKKILNLMLPVLFSVSVGQISLLISTLMASFLVTGSIAWLYYADRLLEFPIGVFGVALATVVLPKLSGLAARNAQEDYNKTLDWSLKWVFLVGVPSTLGLIFLSKPIFVTLFYRGQFGLNDVEMSAQALMAYSIGLLGFVLIKILASGFFARQDTKTPTKVAFISIVSNIVLNFVLIWSLKHVGLALATALSATLNAGLLYFYLRKQDAFQPLKGWGLFLGRIAIASIVMIALLVWFVPNLENWLQWSSGMRFLQLGIWVCSAMIVYFFILWISGLRFKTLLRP
jgi:putative peptidoglycan lipid II flippase